MRSAKNAKVKGTNMLSAVKALRMARDESRKLLPPPLHRYLEERVLVSSWYPEADLMVLLQTLGKILPGDDPFYYMGRRTAAEHLAGIYRGHVRPDDLERTLQSASALWRNYHDTGDMTVTLEGPGRATLQLRDFASTTPEFCRLLRGYFIALAEQAGAKGVDVAKLECILGGGRACRWTMTWT
ncbi:MAG TPA: hypothetical protein VGH63_13705 [Polyangia bacterium]|jgi:hypothetical protein